MYNSILLGLIKEQINGSASSSQFTVSDNLINGLNLHDATGDGLTSFTNVAGDLSVSLGMGETATISENFYGGHTIDFSDPTKEDIIGRPSLFDSETLYQGGSAIGTLEPTMLGDGLTLTTDAVSIVGSMSLFDTVNVKLTSSIAAPTYLSEIDHLETIATSIDAGSVADSFAVVEGLDGLDALDFL